MELDSEDRLAPDRNAGPQDFETLTQAARAAFFEVTAPPVQVIVKKRRLIDEPSAQADTPDAAAMGDAGDEGERRPRVFVLPRDAAVPEPRATHDTPPVDAGPAVWF